MDKLTGGDWEARANEYWDNWHRSAGIAYEEQMRAEAAERACYRLQGIVARLHHADGRDCDCDDCFDAGRDALKTQPWEAPDAE